MKQRCYAARMLAFTFVADPIAVWGLGIAVVSMVIGLVAAVAAIYAAIYAKAAPTKEDLARVEQNTAVTSEHLRDQAVRAGLALKASRVSICVEARGVTADSLLIRLSVRDPSIALTHLALYNEAQSLFGNVVCERVGDLEFAAKILPATMWKWFGGGAPVQTSNCVRLVLEVSMLLDGTQASRQMAVTVCSVQLPDGRQGPGWLVEGEV